MHQPATLSDPGTNRDLGRPFDSGFTAGRFALLLALLIFLAFPQVLCGLASFVVRDFGFFAYPLAHYQRECFWRGELPLWNPYNHCGLPFLAQWNTMALYPPALIYLLLPLNWSLNFFCLLHLFWAGLGMYFLARQWTGSLLGASVAGLMFAFNGLSLNLLMWPSHIATLSWMPWVLLAVERAWTRGGPTLLAAALVGALQMLAGGPETIFFTWVICLAFWLAHLVRSARANGPGAWLKPLRRFPLVVVLVAALCAAQLLPFLDLAAHSQRGAGFADSRWSMPSWGWANLLVPMVFGTAGKQGLFFQYGQYWTSSYYLGLGALLFAAIAVWQVRGARVWLLTAAALLGLVLATGDQTLPSRWARRLVPQLSLMTYPIKFVTVLVFAVPLLAGFGLARLQATPSDAATRRRFLLVAAVLAALIVGVLVWAWRFPFPSDDTAAAIRNGLARLAFLVGAVLLALAVPFTLRSPNSALRTPSLPHSTTPSLHHSMPHLLPLLLVILLWLDVWTHEPPQNPVVPAWVYAPDLARKKLEFNPQPLLGQSRVMVSPAAEAKFRTLVLDDPKDNYLVKRLGFFADCNLLDAVPKVNGFFSLCPRECGELNSALYVSGIPFGPRLQEFLSVSHATAPDEYVKWTARDTFLPLATAGQQPLFLDDTNALRALLSPQFDPRKVVLLPLETKSLVSATNPVPARVTIKTVQAHRVELQVDAPAPALVVLGQTWFHSWRAYIDGRPQPLLRANYAFQALESPAGTHLVQLKYEDRAFRTGALLSGLTLLGCVVAALYSRFLGRRSLGEVGPGRRSLGEVDPGRRSLGEDSRTPRLNGSTP